MRCCTGPRGVHALCAARMRHFCTAGLRHVCRSGLTRALGVHDSSCIQVRAHCLTDIVGHQDLAQCRHSLLAVGLGSDVLGICISISVRRDVAVGTQGPKKISTFHFIFLQKSISTSAARFAGRFRHKANSRGFSLAMDACGLADFNFLVTQCALPVSVPAPQAPPELADHLPGGGSKKRKDKQPQQQPKQSKKPKQSKPPKPPKPHLIKSANAEMILRKIIYVTIWKSRTMDIARGRITSAFTNLKRFR